MKPIFLNLFLLLNIVAYGQQITWNIDPAHSQVQFSTSYFKVATIEGTFNEFSGTFVFDKDAIQDAKVNITLKTGSIDTNQSKRDEHLRSADFFNAEKHPEIIFTSTSFKQIKNDEYELKGKLTLSGIIKFLTLKAHYKGGFTHPRFKNNRRMFEIEGVIPREDFEVGTNYAPSEYAFGKDVQLIALIHLIQE